MAPYYKLTISFLVFLTLLAGCSGASSESPSNDAPGPPTATSPAPSVTTAPPVATYTPTSPPPEDITTPTLVPTTTTAPKLDNGVDGWAVLIAKEDYSDVDMTDILTGFLNLYQERALLGYFGWQEDHILEIRDTVSTQEVREALTWLATNADEDDLVLFHIQAHSRFLRDHLNWHQFFGEDWAAIPSQRRVLIVEACEAGQFTAITELDPSPHLSIASVDADEYGWAGLWEEGLPVIGGVFSHFFLAAFTNPTADVDGDGQISIQEATLIAEDEQRTYMHEVVFAVPEFLEMYNALGSSPDEDPTFPDVVIDDAIGEPLYLALGAYR